jgi:hypothetical protein
LSSLFPLLRIAMMHFTVRGKRVEGTPAYHAPAGNR